MTKTRISFTDVLVLVLYEGPSNGAFTPTSDNTSIRPGALTNFCGIVIEQGLNSLL